jgi:hypothetical protein
MYLSCSTQFLPHHLVLVVVVSATRLCAVAHAHIGTSGQEHTIRSERRALSFTAVFPHTATVCSCLYASVCIVCRTRVWEN